MFKTRQIIPILYLLFAFQFSFSQINLVPNPSFETYTVCPSGFAQWSNTAFWYSPNGNSSDYFNACDNSNTVGVPFNLAGYQPANQGNGYCGWGVSFDTVTNPNYREYLQVQLSSALVAGKEYIVSTYLAKADSAPIVLKNIGIALSGSAITGSVISFTPQITHNSFLTDTANWTLITDTITASGGENYLTIGFFSTNPSDVMVVGSSVYFYKQAYYYTDNVSVKEKLPAGIGTNILEENINIWLSNNLLFVHLLQPQVTVIEIMDLQGTLLYKSEIMDTSEINLSHLSSGLYLLKITTSENSFLKKIIIR